MKTETQQLQEEINALQARLDNITKPKFEVGKWYKWNGLFPAIGMMNGWCKQYPGSISLTLVDGNKTSHDSCSIKNCTPATPEEVKAALIKEAEKRGFKEGVRFKQRYDFDGTGIVCDAHEQDGIVKGRLSTFKNKHSECNLVSDGNGLIFNARSGQWAEIIKDEKIEIGGYEVKFTDASLGFTAIDGNVFEREFWQAAKLISEHSKAKIMIGCSKQFDVSLETINKILKKYE